MAAQTLPNLREILACLMCSRLYFELCLTERLALVKSLASQMENPRTDR